MTVYYPEPGEKVVLKPAGLESALRSAVVDSLSGDRTITYGERENLGVTRDDVQAYAAARGREAARLRAVLECVKAGVAELPAELYFNAYHGRSR